MIALSLSAASVIALAAVVPQAWSFAPMPFLGGKSGMIHAPSTAKGGLFMSAVTPVADYEVVLKDDADLRFPSLSLGFNMRWRSSNCERIYLTNTPEGVRQAVDETISLYGAGKTKIMSGGHCYENFVFNEDTFAVINVTPLLDWGYDEEHEAYFLSSGDTNWGAFKKIFRHLGKVLPGGSCYSVGLGGHISGGGDGVLSRLQGLTVDWLTGVEVVVKPDENLPAELKYVGSDSEDPDDVDLFWAHTGGGGGNFGVITKYYFATLPDAPTGVVTSVLHFDWNTITKQNLADTLNYYFDLAMDDDTMDKRRTVGKFQIQHKAAGEFQMYLQTCYFDEEQRAAAQELHWDLEQAIEGVMPTCEPTKVLGGHGGWFSFPKRERRRHLSRQSFVSDDTNEYPFYQSTQTINGSGPNQRGKYKSAYMLDKFPSDQIDAIWEHLQAVPEGLTMSDMKDSLLQCDIFAGTINDKTSDETAIAQRQYYVKLQYQTYWQDPDKDDGHLQWIQDFYNDMYANYGGVPDPIAYPDLFEGCYYNYPDIDLNVLSGGGKIGALYLYFLDNIIKLSEVKATWDPNDYFCHAQSIPPTPLEVRAFVEAAKARGKVNPDA